jgi:hypothetical protein
MISKKNLRLCNILHESKSYDILVAVDVLDQIDNVLQEWALTNLGEALDLPQELVFCKDITEVLTAYEVDNFAYLQSSTSSYMDMPRYAGLSGLFPTLPDILVGGYYVMPEAVAFLYSEAGFSGYFGEYNVAEADLSVSAGVNYIGITFNSGLPIFQVYSDFSSFNFSSIIPVAAVLSFAGTLYNIPLGQSGYAAPEKLHKLALALKKFDIVGTFTLTGTSRYVQLSAITVSNGIETLSVPAVDTQLAVNDMYMYYRDGSSVWQNTKITQLSNSQYQGSGLQSLSPGEYVVHSLFRVPDQSKLLIFTVPSTKYSTVQDAINSAEAQDLPDIIKNSAVLVGRAIIVEAGSAAIIQKVQKTSFGI